MVVKSVEVDAFSMDLRHVGADKGLWVGPDVMWKCRRCCWMMLVDTRVLLKTWKVVRTRCLRGVGAMAIVKVS